MAKGNRTGGRMQSATARRKRVATTSSTRLVGTKKKQRRTSAPIELAYRGRTPSDDAFIVQLTKEQLGTIHQEAFGEPFPENQFLRYIQSGAPTMMIQRGEHPIGYYSYLLGEPGKMHVTALVIDKKHQSVGVGKEVMKKLERDARAMGVVVMEVFVQDTNESSLEFTKGLGFVEAYRIDPHTIAFQKRLTPTL